MGAPWGVSGPKGGHAGGVIFCRNADLFGCGGCRCANFPATAIQPDARLPGCRRYYWLAVFDLISDSKQVHKNAALGVVFPLFTMVLELDVDRWKLIRDRIFGVGTAKVVVTSVVIALTARAVGFSVETSTAAARVVNLLHARFSNLNIYLRARDKSHKLCLTEASASGIVNGSCELSILLGGAVLRDCSTPDEQIRQIVRDHRAED
tara:strand:- start:284 stop:904 length:621 start_codon:yes stop_codon:yes gene_type:complete